jgi:hypothetical protein
LSRQWSEGDDETPSDEDEWVEDGFDDEPDSLEFGDCPKCGKSIAEDSVRCPYCGDYVTMNTGHVIRSSPMMMVGWLLAMGVAAGGLLAIFLSMLR